MKDYDQYYDQQANQEDLNEDEDMNQFIEQNQNPNIILLPLDVQDNQENHFNINLVEQNHQNINVPLNNQQINQEGNSLPNDNEQHQNDNQNNIYSNCEIEILDELTPQHGEDEKLEDVFYPALARVEVNSTLSTYQYSENQASEQSRTNNQQAQNVNYYEKTTDISMKKTK